MLYTRFFSRGRHIFCLCCFFFCRIMCPEKSYKVSAVCSFQCFLHTFFIVDIGCYHFGAHFCKFLCFIRIGIACYCTNCKFTVRIIEYGMSKSSALCACSAENSDNFFNSHEMVCLRFVLKISNLLKPGRNKDDMPATTKIRNYYFNCCCIICSTSASFTSLQNVKKISSAVARSINLSLKRRCAVSTSSFICEKE